MLGELGEERSEAWDKQARGEDVLPRREVLAFWPGVFSGASRSLEKVVRGCS